MQSPENVAYLPVPAAGRPHPVFTVPPPPLPPVAARRAATEITFGQIALRLSIQDCAARSQVDQLRALARSSGFPLPKRPRIEKGVEVTGARAITTRSVWDRDLVDDWFNNRLPPETQALRTEARANALRTEMRDRALRLVGREAA